MKKYLLAAAVSAALAAPAHASLFNVNINAGGQSQSYGFGNAADAIDTLDLSAIERQITEAGGAFDRHSSAASVGIDYRGIDLGANYAENSQVLHFRIAALGINESFNGATREESMDMLKEWLKGEGGSAVNRLNQALVASSPFDPLAGNPSSLMANMVDGAFDYANDVGVVGNQGTENTFNMSVSYGQYSIAGKDVETYRVPLSYTIRFDNDLMKGHRLQFRAPLSYTEIDGHGKSYTVTLGVGYTFPVPFIDGLEMTPAFDYGVMGSEDLYSAAAMKAFSLTTRYEFSLLGQDFAISNSLADLSTDSISYEDIEVDAGLSNRAMTNGIMWKPAAPGNFRIQAFLRDTRYSGDELYSERSNEVGVSLGHKRASIFGNPVFVGASYFFTDRDDLDGFKVNFGASF